MNFSVGESPGLRQGLEKVFRHSDALSDVESVDCVDFVDPDPGTRNLFQLALPNPKVAPGFKNFVVL